DGRQPGHVLAAPRPGTPREVIQRAGSRSLRQIADALNARGISAPRGGPALKMPRRSLITPARSELLFCNIQSRRTMKWREDDGGIAQFGSALSAHAGHAAV